MLVNGLAESDEHLRRAIQEDLRIFDHVPHHEQLTFAQGAACNALLHQAGIKQKQVG